MITDPISNPRRSTTCQGNCTSRFECGEMDELNRNSKTVMSVRFVRAVPWKSCSVNSGALLVMPRQDFVWNFGVTSTASRSICVTSTSRVRRVDLLASLRDETVSPSAVLSHAKTLYTPKSDGKIVVPRDRQIKGDEKSCSKMYALKLSYDVSVANDDKASGVSFGIHPLNDLLYESPFQSQLVTVRDANGKIVHHSDAWPHKYKASSLSSGTYKVDIDLRHESESVLEKFKKASLTVTQSLKSKITVPVYKSMSDAILGKTWSGPVKLSKGQSVAMFLGVPSDDAVSKAVPKNFSNQVAQSLSGSVTYCKRTLLSGTCPSKITLEVTASGSKSSGASSSSSASSSSKKLEDLIRDAKLSHLRTLSAAALKPPSKSKETKEEEEKKEDPKATYEDFLKEMLTSDSTFLFW